jgi:hypothetical protein
MALIYDTITQTTAQGGNLANLEDVLVDTWENVRNASTASNITTPPGFSYVTEASLQTGRATRWAMQRGYLVFDLSSIPAGNILQAKLNLYCVSINNSNYTPGVMINYATSPTLTTALSTSDWYNPINSTALCTAFTPSTGWNDIPLNGTAYSLLESESQITFVIRDNFYDYEYYTNLTDPTATGSCTFSGDSLGEVPYLEYIVNTGYDYTINGIITANYTAVDSISKFSIDGVNGINTIPI